MLDGDEYLISNYTFIATEALDDAAMIATISDATIKNMIFKNVSIKGSDLSKDENDVPKRTALFANVGGEIEFTNINVVSTKLDGKGKVGLIGQITSGKSTFNDIELNMEIAAGLNTGPLLGSLEDGSEVVASNIKTDVSINFVMSTQEGEEYKVGGLIGLSKTSDPDNEISDVKITIEATGNHRKPRLVVLLLQFKRRNAYRQCFSKQ